MTTEAQTTLLRLASSVKVTEPSRIERLTGEKIENAVFAGCGDSLAAALLAEHYGHHAKSSGDLVWCSRRRRGACDSRRNLVFGRDRRNGACRRDGSKTGRQHGRNNCLSGLTAHRGLRSEPRGT